MKSFINYFLIKIIFLTSLLVGELFSNKELLSKEFINKNQNSSVYKNTNNIESKYILGANDGLQIIFNGIPEYSNNYFIGPDGLLYLPEIKSIKAEGLTIDELREKLISLYNSFIFEPNIEIFISKYRIIRAYISGEVTRPGFYSFEGQTILEQRDRFKSDNSQILATKPQTSTYQFPTVFDAIVKASGVTQNANLQEITVKRFNSKSQGGGIIQTNLNFLELITEGDLNQNIRIFDGDIIQIKRSDKILKDQILLANKTNLKPQSFVVFITGNVRQPGATIVPQGSSLIQALSSSGGLKILSGNIEFVRFNDDGKSQKNVFKFDPDAPLNSEKNPILMSGDVINVRRSSFGYTAKLFDEIGSPIFKGFALWQLFD